MTRADERPDTLVTVPLGVRPDPAGGFAAWIPAPGAESVAVVVDAGGDAERSVPLRPAGHHDLWHGAVPSLAHGDRYVVEVDGERTADPWSRWQPDGSDGAAAVVDPGRIGASGPDGAGRPPPPAHPPTEVVLYELHVGSITRGGGFADVVAHLDRLAELGVTHLELLPVGQFPGRHGWGYDGIFWSAAQHSYGGPAELVRLVDAAHQRGLAVVLDVVFNHVGPTGDHVYAPFGPFFTDRHRTPWGAAVNVDGAGSDIVRETIFQTAEWWVGAVGVDGLRVDACHAIVDQSARHVLAELTARVKRLRPDALLVAESGLNDPRTVRSEDDGGWGFSADWADDFHHALVTLLRDDDRAWLADFGSIADLAKACRRPYVHDGTWSSFRGRRFGASAAAIDPERFVVFAQNHDQIGNRPVGDRLPVDRRRLALLLVLLSPFTPMLFFGDEYGETAPFPFFSDHTDPFIADATRRGRQAEFAAFAARRGEQVPDPQDPATFASSWPTGEEDPATVELVRSLLACRRSLPRGDAEVRFDEAARWLRVERGDTVLLANFSDVRVEIPCPPGDVEVATDPATARPGPDRVAVPAGAGAFVRVRR